MATGVTELELELELELATRVTELELAVDVPVEETFGDDDGLLHNIVLVEERGTKWPGDGDG